jgi:hypothetical protein
MVTAFTEKLPVRSKILFSKPSNLNYWYELLSYIGKAVPQHTYGKAGRERMYSSYSFTTSALDVDE